jgi:hypothetical protein
LLVSNTTTPLCTQKPLLDDVLSKLSICFTPSHTM